MLGGGIYKLLLCAASCSCYTFHFIYKYRRRAAARAQEGCSWVLEQLGGLPAIQGPMHQRQQAELRLWPSPGGWELGGETGGGRLGGSTAQSRLGVSQTPFPPTQAAALEPRPSLVPLSQPIFWNPTGSQAQTILFIPQ